MLIGNNSAGDADVASGPFSVSLPSRYHRFHSNTMFALTSCRCAMTETDAPGAKVSRTTCCLNSSGYTRCVRRQYCGQLGKQDNCQVAVSLSVATEDASLRVSYRLYLPREWSDDPARRQKAGVPEEIEFAPKPEIATGQLHEARQSGAPDGIVLANAGYGDDTSFREAVSELGLQYAMGIRSNTRVWAPSTAPLPPESSAGKSGQPRSLLRRAPGHEPIGVKDLALTLDASRYRNVIWREGTCAALSSRFAAVRVRASHRDYWRSTLHDEEWLLIEWPEGDAEPLKYWLSTLPPDTTLERMVHVAEMCWRIERDYQDLKQEFGLGHFEGRGWRGFHYHAS